MLSIMPIRWMTLFLDLPAARFDAATTFWTEVTGTTLSAMRGANSEFATLLPADGDAYLRVQRTADGSGGRHLDLHIDAADQTLDQVAARATALGATVRHREVLPTGVVELVVLTSPGGFTFCLVPWDGESSVPAPIGPPSAEPGHGGRRSRLDQLCLDVPADRLEDECSFWSALTGWELRSAGLPEFSYLVRAEGLPVRLLFQRRDQAEPGETVRGHLDFADDDPAVLVDWHVAAGATLVQRFEQWITLTDPAGQPYCLTYRDPVTGTSSR
jgi:predicted enzyme related to lactoylglutathione lyase